MVCFIVIFIGVIIFFVCLICMSLGIKLVLIVVREVLIKGNKYWVFF